MLYLAVYLSLCVLVAYAGRKKKFGYTCYLTCSVLFTPFIGLLLVIGSDSK